MLEPVVRRQFCASAKVLIELTRLRYLGLVDAHAGIVVLEVHASDLQVGTEPRLVSSLSGGGKRHGSTKLVEALAANLHG